MKYSLCIETILPDMDFYERIAMASKLGFDAVEFWDPSKRDIRKAALYAKENSIEIAACCVVDPVVNNLCADPQSFCEALTGSAKLAKVMGSPSLIILSGNINPCENQKMLIADNLKRAAMIAHKEEIDLLLEPLNSIIDHKGYYLDSSLLAFELIRQVSSGRIKVLFDCYHMCVMNEDVLKMIKDNIFHIGHFHTAGVPGRHEPQNGSPDHAKIVKSIKKSGYSGYFGFEYFPSYDHMKSLKDVLKYFKDIKNNNTEESYVTV